MTAPDIESTHLLPVVDEQTIEELRPPCEIGEYTTTGMVVRRCDDPAEWVVGVDMSCGCRYDFLTCTPDKDAVYEAGRNSRLRCKPCKGHGLTGRVILMERL